MEKYRLPVKEECKGFYIPKDINAFIKELYPNIVVSVESKMGKSSFNNEIISEFIVYMLSKTPRGIQRYQTYNSEKKVPFFKWFLLHINYFKMQHKTRLKRNSIFIPLVENVEEEDNSITVKITAVLREESKQIEMCYFEQVKNFLEEYSFIYKDDGGFKGKVSELFDIKYKGYNKKDIAKYFNIGITEAGKWEKGLKKILKEFESELYFN
jgi:hypothetical protein